MRSILLTACLGLLLSPTVSNAEIQLTAYLETGGSNAVAVHGDYVFGGLGRYLLTVDATNPANPVRVGSRVLSTTIYDIVVAGQLAYVGTGNNLSIFDISNPSYPVLLGVESSSEAIRMGLSGTIAFTTQGSEGIRSIDVTNPAQPVSIGSVTAGNWPYGIRIVGSHAYATGFLGDLAVIDISNPAVPSVIALLSVPSSGWDLEVAGQHAYLPHPYGLAIVDVSIPSSPFLVGNYSDSFVDGTCVSIKGNYAYLLGLYGDLEILDVSDPTNPVSVKYEYAMGGGDVDRVGDYLYVADDYSSFHILDTSDHLNPVVLGTYHSLASAATLALHNGLMFIGESGRITSMGVEDAASPDWVGEVENNHLLTRVLIPSGSGLFVGREASIFDGGDGGLSIFDITQPATPIELSTKWGFDVVYDLFVDGSYLYLLGGPRSGLTTLVTYDISNFAAPIQLSSVGVPFQSSNFDMSGDLAIVAGLTNDLKIYDVSDHTNPPVLKSTFTATSDARDVDAVGTTAFVADALDGLIMVDFSNPTSPTELGRLSNLGQPANIVAVYPYVVMVGSDPLLRILDVEDPTSLSVVDSYQIGGSREVAVEGSTIATIVTNPRAVVLFDAPILESPTSIRNSGDNLSLGVYPNPFNPRTTIAFTLPAAANVTLEVFDSTGRRIRGLVNQLLAGREHRVTWDGRDDTGARCASGVYFCRLRAGNETVNHKLVLLK